MSRILASGALARTRCSSPGIAIKFLGEIEHLHGLIAGRIGVRIGTADLDALAAPVPCTSSAR